MIKLNVIHINSYFLSNKIHFNFYKIIRKYRQDEFLIPVYDYFKNKHINGIDIDYVYTKLDKSLFFTKVIKVFLLFYRKHHNKEFACIHAHTLISDGIPAYLLSLITQKTLFVTVRGTDVIYFIKKSNMFRYIAEIILKKAKIVFFISPTYRKRILTLYPSLDANKLLLLPNGVDDFWYSNMCMNNQCNKDFKVLNILFVGRVTKQKNLEILIDFLEEYDDRSYNLTIVGSNNLNWDFSLIGSKIKNGNTINYLGEVNDMNALLKIYRNHDVFIMLSPEETFGVVYIEALTQGLPIIYTKGDGIDGYFQEGEVGYSCDHTSIVDLKIKVDDVIANYNAICKNIPNVVSNFEWEYLGKKYIKLTSLNE